MSLFTHLVACLSHSQASIHSLRSPHTPTPTHSSTLRMRAAAPSGASLSWTAGGNISKALYPAGGRSRRAPILRLHCVAQHHTGGNSQQQLQSAPQHAEEMPGESRIASTVSHLIAQPSTCASALAGFCLIASNIPLASADGSAAEASIPAQSALQQLLLTTTSSGAGAGAGAGAAQAASIDAAASQVQQPAASSVLQPMLSNPVLQLDEAIHHFVATHTSESFRLMADVFISDAFIIAGVLGWVACTAACLSKAPGKTAGALVVAWAFYFATCGAVGHGDPLLVDGLKHLFARSRPSTLHHTFSFPSGHTSAAVFVVGSFLTVLLPLTVQLFSAQQATSSSSSSKSISEPASSPTTSSAVALGRQMSGASIVAADAVMLAVWAAAWATTAAGRILSESHWLSDTLAGGLLAAASVSGLACCTRLLVPQSTEARTSAPRDV